MLYRPGVILLIFMGSTAALAQTGPSSLPTDQPMPRDTLDRIYRAELGALYRPADAGKYYDANQLIETYFSRSSDRRDTVRSLDALGLNPNIVGRLTRVRMTWPQLSGGVYYINERLGPHDVRYYLGIPKAYDRAKPWPLVIKLPTADVFVAEPRPDPVQVTQIYAAWMTEELAAHPDAIVIMPLLNLDELWGPSYAGMDSVIQPMLHAANRANIDPARVYMVGHAMSANATWNFALHYTTYFAAFNALAGGATADWQRLRLMNLRNILPVVWHDSDDQVLRVDTARDLVRAIRGLKLDIDYQETRNIGHVPSTPIAEQGYTKMRSRTRELYPKQIALQSNRPDTMFNRNDWAQIYQPLNPGAEKRLLFSRGSGMMLVYPNSFSADATVSQNTITMNARNVESLRFYLNDQLIDFSKSVSVVQNRRQRFEGILKPGIEEMLKDQLFMGRGWRYYTAVIDIDLSARTPTTRP